MIAGILFGFVPLLIWLYLLLRPSRLLAAARARHICRSLSPTHWPSVVAVVPARNEADVIQQKHRQPAGAGLSRSIPYRPGGRPISDDGTAESGPCHRRSRLTVLTGSPRPPGWTGKLWAMSQGSDRAAGVAPEFFWFTDADIAHSPDNLRQLVARAEAGKAGSGLADGAAPLPQRRPSIS